MLIKSVAQSLPTYAMSIFLLTLDISKDIERSLAKFWWGCSLSQGKKINCLSWDRMCIHKSAGGLDFRNFRYFNLAMLGKQAWRLLTKPKSMVTKVYKA